MTETKTTYTPGPWSIRLKEWNGSCEDCRDGSIGSVKGDGLYVAKLEDLGDEESLPEQLANARLIAAAPMLYEALKALTDTVESRFEGLEIVALVPQDLRRDIQQARAALAAAEPQAGV